MGRPVEIDRTEAFKSATELFWRQGYGATSLQQLLEATGMGKGSFYAAFGSKEALFESVIDDYQARSSASFEKIRAGRQGLDAIQAFISRTLLDVSAANRQKGCLLVNSVLELEGVDARLHERASDCLDGLRRTLIGCFQEAQDASELATAASPEALGNLLTSLLQGWRVASRRGASQAQLRSETALFFNLIGAASTAR
jgi:TetR/AcrR family transcriptional repressor of nem operon